MGIAVSLDLSALLRLKVPEVDDAGDFDAEIKTILEDSLLQKE